MWCPQVGPLVFWCARSKSQDACLPAQQQHASTVAALFLFDVAEFSAAMIVLHIQGPGLVISVL